MTLTAPSAPFAFVPADHPLRPVLDAILADLPAQRATLPAAGARVVAEARGRRDGAGWTADRVYCSLQATDPATGSFDARTVLWSAANREPQWVRLPEDPYLPGLAACVAPAGADGIEVLRYVPLRRFTYRTGRRVVKVKRRSRLLDSWSRAQAVAHAAPRSGQRVPALLGLDQERSCYTQVDEQRPALSDQAAGSALAPLLGEAGAVHARFHRIPAAPLPAGEGPDAVLGAALRSASWASAMLPALAGVLQRAGARLASTVPHPAGADDLATCHGDLVPSHLLGGSGDWCVIDLDLAHRGDRYQDLAMFVAGLAYDVPALADGVAADPTQARAATAYLDGYRDTHAHRLDEDRLRWHLLAAHVHHAGLLVTKDRAHPAAVTGTLARLEAALDAVGRARAGPRRSLLGGAA
ncbi:MAG TPA: phosphotransferase [Dermatophilaceae bacterium]|nr:phosphotransferase [Dermatophilaceae bacterium]